MEASGNGGMERKGQDQEALSICMPAGGDADDQDPQCLIDSRRFSQHSTWLEETSLPSLDTSLRQRASRNGQAPKILGVSDPDRVLTSP